MGEELGDGQRPPRSRGRAWPSEVRVEAWYFHLRAVAADRRALRSSRREEIYYYKAGGPCGDKFDLCKVMCMSDLTPWALSSAFFCSAADCVLVACSVPDQWAAGQARVGREFSRCSVVSSALQLVSLRTPRHLIVFMQAGAFGGPKVLCALIGACRFLVSGGRRSMHLPSAGVAPLPCRACH